MALGVDSAWVQRGSCSGKCSSVFGEAGCVHGALKRDSLAPKHVEVQEHV